MLMSSLDNECLYGSVEYDWHGHYIVRIRMADFEGKFHEPFYVMSFHDGVTAENRLVELMEHPVLTILKYI